MSIILSILPIFFSHSYIFYVFILSFLFYLLFSFTRRFYR